MQHRKGISELLYLDKNELFIYRAYCMVSMFCFPIYGYTLMFLVPDCIDYMSHRFLIGFYWAAVLGISFSFKDQRLFVVLLFIGNIIMICWLGWIVYVNNFNSDYSIGLFLMFSCCSIISRSRIEMIFYTILFFASGIPSFFIEGESGISPLMFLLSLSILTMAYFLILTWREKTVNRLRELNQELSFKNEELERFVFAVSHDLKSPLRTIGSFSTLLQRRIDSGQTESVGEYTNFIIGGVNRMTKVIEDILDYARYGNSKIQFEQIPLKILIKEVSDDVIAEEKKNVVIDLSTNLPDQIVGNTTQIKQIFQNLIENAIKYNLSPDKKIWIDYQASNQFHNFEISDNGIGIDLQYKEKIFELFQRLHHTHEFKGTGIGLAICKRIVENHNGSIDIRERTGGGTVFQFQIKKQLLTKSF